MKKLIPLIMATVAFPAFTQVIDRNVGLSFSANESINDEQYFANQRRHSESKILPVTIDVTKIISSSDFSNRDILELRATLLKGSYLEEQVYGSKATGLFLGIGGELLSLDRQRLFFKSGVDTFTSLELLKLEGIALFAIEDRVYMQVNAYVAGGAALNSRKTDMFNVPGSYVQEYLDQGHCIGCDINAPDWKSNSALVRAGTNVEIRYKNLSLDLFHRSSYITETNSWDRSYATSLPEDVKRADNYIDKHFKQQEVGLTVTYRLSRDNSPQNLALFAGVNLRTLSKGISGKSSLYAQDSRFYQNKYHGHYADYDAEVHRTGFVTIGVRANLSSLFKKKK